MTDKARFFYGYIIVIISFFMMMVILGLHASFGIFFKPILKELGWSRAVTSGAFSLSLIMHGLLGIVLGWLNDRFGPRLVMTVCGLLSGAGYLLMSQVQSVWHLYLFYGVIIGIGCSIFVPLLSTIARWFIQRRSLMSGIVVAGSGVGMLFLPPLINRLISLYNWRISFLILGMIILIVVVSPAQLLKRDPGQVGQVAFGENDAIEKSHGSETGAFTLKEAVFTRQFWMLIAVMMCYGFCIFSIQVHIAPYTTDAGVPEAGAANILAAVGGSAIIGQTVLGSLGDRIGNRPAFLIGLVLLGIAVFGLMQANALWSFYLFACILGLAFGDLGTQESPIVAWLFGLRSHGLIFGFSSFGFTIGAAIGPVWFGHIFDTTGNYRFAFLICILISIFSILLTICLKPTTAESAPLTGNAKVI